MNPEEEFPALLNQGRSAQIMLPLGFEKSVFGVSAPRAIGDE